MALKQLNVEITQEHFARSIKGSPREAIKELIWNACDADAKTIEISFSYSGIPGAETISDIYVKDDGHGIPVECIEEYFGKMQIYECFSLDNCINTRFLCWKNAKSHVGKKNIALH